MVKNTSYKVHVQKNTDAEIADVKIEQGAMMVSDTGLYMGYNGENVRVYPQQSQGQGLGWARISDTQYNSSNKLELDDGQWVVLPNNAGNVVTNNGDSYYDSVTKKFESTTVNDVYVLTLVFKAQTINTVNCHLDIRMTGPGEIDRIAKSLDYYKGNNTTQSFHEVIQYYTDADFVTNGAQIEIKSDGRDSDIWDITYFIQKTQSYA